MTGKLEALAHVAWAVLRRLLALGRQRLPPRPPLRLRELEVQELAAAAFLAAGIGRDRPHPYGTIVSLPRFGDSPLLWVVGTATIGSGWRVSVDDASGEVGPVTRWGLR